MHIYSTRVNAYGETEKRSDEGNQRCEREVRWKHQIENMCRQKKPTWQIHKGEISSPTVSTDSLMLMLMNAAVEGHDVAMADVAGAFLKADTDFFCANET